MGRFGEAPNATVPTHILRITRTHHTCATRMVEVLDRAQRNRHLITFDAAEFFSTFAPAVANAPDHSTILSPVGELDRETRVDRTASIHPAMAGIAAAQVQPPRSIDVRTLLYLK
jgi:hypothetical protein